MAITPTKPIPLGFIAPSFELKDVVSGKQITYNDIKGKTGTLVIFICNHCPYVIHIIDELVRVAKAYQPLGIGFVAINSNDAVRFPDDSPDKMVLFAQKHSFSFPYLFDESQEVARAYDAACTPDFNLFDTNDHCVYRGQFDSSRPGNSTAITGSDLRSTLDLLLEGKKIPEAQLPSIGCNIKWKE